MTNPTNQSPIRSGNITLKDRASLFIDGVENVLSFDENTVILQTTLGELTIDGEEMTVSRLSVEEGKIDITGRIYGLFYTDDRVKKRSFFGKSGK